MEDSAGLRRAGGPEEPAGTGGVVGLEAPQALAQAGVLGLQGLRPPVQRGQRLEQPVDRGPGPPELALQAREFLGPSRLTATAGGAHALRGVDLAAVLLHDLLSRRPAGTIREREATRRPSRRPPIGIQSQLAALERV